MDKQKNTYTGRFAGGAAKPAQEAVPRRAQPRQERKPSGFASAGQTPRRSVQNSAPEAQPANKKAKLKKERTKRAEKKPFSLMRFLSGVLIVALIALILLVIFGDRGTYHQMPTITREEAEGSFAPEETPLPGVEEAIE